MTGMRRGEALGLGWGDLDMEGGPLTIRRAWIPVIGVAQMSEPKSRRTIALDPVTLEALRTHAARQADEQSRWAQGYVEAGFVFTRPDGRPLVPGRPCCRRSRSMVSGIPTPPWPWPPASTRASSRDASATPRWPSPWMSTPTCCPSRTARPRRRSPPYCSRERPSPRARPPRSGRDLAALRSGQALALG
jgi:hypothetical protein